MTLDDLQRLSDDALIEKVAVELMGWDAKTHMRDWSWRNDMGERWNPLTDWNHAAEVVRRMRDHWGMRYAIKLLANGKTSVEFIRLGVIDGYCAHKDAARAVCLAALLALSPDAEPPTPASPLPL